MGRAECMLLTFLPYRVAASKAGSCALARFSLALPAVRSKNSSESSSLQGAGKVCHEPVPVDVAAVRPGEGNCR